VTLGCQALGCNSPTVYIILAVGAACEAKQNCVGGWTAKLNLDERIPIKQTTNVYECCVVEMKVFL